MSKRAASPIVGDDANDDDTGDVRANVIAARKKKAAVLQTFKPIGINEMEYPSSVVKWLNNMNQWDGWNLRPKKGDRCTHVLMDGGRLLIPPELIGRFYAEYAKSLYNREAMYFCEQKYPNEVYRCLMDIDMLTSKPIEMDEVVAIVKVIQTIISRMYPKLPPARCRVAICMTKDVEYRGNFIKNGIHLIWPEIYINNIIGHSFRIMAIRALEETFGETSPQRPETWDKIIDAEPYGQKRGNSGSGLRMIGSRKTALCPDCLGTTRRAVCSTCRQKGKVDLQRVYEPVLVLDGKGIHLVQETQLLIQNIVERVKQLHIRTQFLQVPLFPIIDRQEHDDDEAANLDIMAGEEQEEEEKPYFTEDIDMKKSTCCTTKDKKETVARRKYDEDEEGKSEQQESLKLTLVKDVRAEKLANFIKKHFPMKPDITDVSIADNQCMYLAHSTSKFCQNLKKHHNGNGTHHSNSVWFLVTRKGVQQKCFCRCPAVEDRIFGLCSLYASEPVPLPPSLHKLLFPNEITGDVFDYTVRAVYDHLSQNQTQLTRLQHQFPEEYKDYTKRSLTTQSSLFNKPIPDKK